VTAVCIARFNNNSALYTQSNIYAFHNDSGSKGRLFPYDAFTDCCLLWNGFVFSVRYELNL